MGKRSLENAGTRDYGTNNENLHVVTRGESPWGIAHHYGVPMGAIYALNPFSRTMIHPGDSILLPPRDIDADNNRRNIPSSHLPENNVGTHVVQKGESPWSIAHKYGIPLNAFYALNPKAKKMIHPGDIVTLPVGIHKPIR